MKNFSKLSFDKKTIARLNNEQLRIVKGGRNFKDGDKIICRRTNTTKVCSTTSSTNCNATEITKTLD